MFRMLTIVLSVGLLAAPVCSQSKAPNSVPPAVTPKSDDRAVQVDALLAEWSKGETPGLTVIVIQDGRVLLKKGYGLSNVEAKEALGPTTVFDLASVSKQFTAMAIMILAERGKLSLEDPLTKFFPEFPAYATKITVRHLLNHTSGIPDYIQAFMVTGKIDKEWKPGGHEPTSADTVKLLSEQKEPRFVPGEKFEYSNSGYVVLGQIVGKAAGKPLPRFLKENVFVPLGMKNTLVADESKPTIKNRAISYRLAGEKYVNADYTPLNLIYGDGNVNTTVEDMLLWDQALYTEKLVSKSLLKQAFTSGKLNSGEETGYGFGWSTGKYGELERVSHSGGWAGFRTEIMRFPEQRFTVVVLSNFVGINPPNIAKKIARIYLGDKLKLPLMPKLDATVLNKYVGKYELRPQFILTFTLENSVLRVQATGQQKLTLVAKSEVDFYVEEIESIGMTFNKDEKGDVVSVTVHQGGDREAKKIK